MDWRKGVVCESSGACHQPYFFQFCWVVMLLILLGCLKILSFCIKSLLLPSPSNSVFKTKLGKTWSGGTFDVVVGTLKLS